MTTTTNELSFGLIADLHFLDAENGKNFAGTKIRRFRQSHTMLQQADAMFHANSTDFNIQLGDLLDGSAHSRGIRDLCLDEIFQVTRQSASPWHFLLGNHECYNFTRDEMKEHFVPSTHQSMCSPSRLYYDFSPKPGYRCICLDGYEICTMRASTPENQDFADKLIVAKNHNYAAGSNDWFKDLPADMKRYVPFNGTISNSQLHWLRETLRDAEKAQEKCVIFCHMPVYAPASQEQNVMWTCEEVLEALHSVTAGTVLAYINGHDHDGGYAVDSRGIHHITPPAPIECDEGEVSYGVMKVDADFSLRLEWVGKVPPGNVWPARMMPPAALSPSEQNSSSHQSVNT